MKNLLTQLHYCLRFRHLMVTGGFLCLISSAFAQKSCVLPRKPASVVEDDAIVKPIDVEIGFYEKHIQNDNSQQVTQTKARILNWQTNQVMAQSYGLDTRSQGSIYFVPTAEENWQYMQKTYLRYLKGKGEQPLREEPKNAWNQWNASREVETIDEMENRFKSTQGKASSKSSAMPKALQDKEIKVTDKVRVHLQPRLDQGLVIVRLQNPWIETRAWVGVRGKNEINLQKTYQPTGTRAMVNYYTDTGQYLTALDQRLIDHVSLRFTSTRNKNSQDKFANENSAGLYFNTGF